MNFFIHSKTSTVQTIKFLNRQVISVQLSNGCHYLSKPRLKLNHVCERGQGDKVDTESVSPNEDRYLIKINNNNIYADAYNYDWRHLSTI